LRGGKGISEDCLKKYNHFVSTSLFILKFSKRVKSEYSETSELDI